MAACSACTQPAPDSTICRSCTDQAAGHLRQLGWLDDELVLTLTRQARFTNPNAARSRETPLMFNMAASIDRETFRGTLTRWAVEVSNHRHVTVDAQPTTHGLALWLLRWNGAAAQLPDAADYLAELAAMTKAAQRTIDRAPDLRYIGPCDDCEQDMYVLAGSSPRTVRCRTDECGAEYLLEERRAWLIEQTYNQLLTAHEMSRAIAELVPGQPITPNRISQWAARGKITKYLPHPHDAHKRARFLVEDVITQLRAGMEKGRASA